jgi:hypothetical protein
MELQKVLAIDPITNVEETYKMKEVVYKSNVNNSQFQYRADSYSDTNIIFNNITPPSLNTILPRCLKLRYTLGVIATNFTGAGSAPLPANIYSAIALNQTAGAVTRAAGYGYATSTQNVYAVNQECDAPYCNMFLADSPLQVCATAIELRINGSSTSTSPNDYVMLYSHMVSDDDLKGEASVYPHQKDLPLYQANNVAIAANNFRASSVAWGTNVSIPSKASFTWKLVQTNQATANGNTLANSYTVEVEEDLYISPMVWGELIQKCAGLSNVNNLTLNVRLDNLQRAIRCVPSAANATTLNASSSVYVSLYGINLSSATPAIQSFVGSQPILDLIYYTPDPILAAKMPSVVAYDYSYLQSFITSNLGGAVTGNVLAFNNQSLNSIRLPSIPKRIFVYAKPSKSFLSGTALNTVPDVFCRITSLKITFNNRINLLANDSTQTLYERSKANGLTDSWLDWNYHTGSIMIIDVAKDLGLEADECTGQSNKYSTLQVQISADTQPCAYYGNGQLNATNAWDFYVLVESPGKAFITPSDCQYVLTGPSSAEVLALTSNLENVVDHDELKPKAVAGGAFSFGNLLKSGARMIKNINPDHVASGVKAVQNAMGALGMGVAGGDVAGGKMKHKRVY